MVVGGDWWWRRLFADLLLGMVFLLSSSGEHIDGVF